MTQIEIIKIELDNEAAITRKILGLVPEDKYTWSPHEKSMKMKPLVVHIAELPSWIAMVLTTKEMDFAANPYVKVEVNNNAELLMYFEKSMLQAKNVLNESRDEMLKEMWTLRDGKMILSEDTKMNNIRMSLNQIIHHRAQLGVYLRILNVPLPASYGPSADHTY